MNRFTFAFALLSGMLFSACGESTFSADSSKKGSGKKKAKTDNTSTVDPTGAGGAGGSTAPGTTPGGAGGTGSTPGTGGETTPLPPGVPPSTPVGNGPCTESGVTQVRLLTASAQNNSANQSMRYEISLLDCNGKPKPIPQAPLLFDIDAESLGLGMFSPLNFSIENSQGVVIQSGTMKTINGSDLFGNKGLERFHWSTENLQINGTDYKLFLIADVSNRDMKPFGSSGKPTGQMQYDTYLRIGDAQPVQQKINWVYP